MKHLKIDSDLLAGNKKYQVRARETLPYLVKRAQVAEKIFYSDLAFQMNYPNPRSFNYILGKIGKAIQELEIRYKTQIPKIQCIVVDKKDGLPGKGVGWYLPSNNKFNELTKEQKKNYIDEKLFEIYNYKDWNWVLEKLGLKPVLFNLEEELDKARNFRGGGESEQHRKFKEFISKNPNLIGISNSLTETVIEYKLPSADKIDVLFAQGKAKFGVEVKSNISNHDDILRGIFQCVKYKSLLEAEQKAKNEMTDSVVILALEGELPLKYQSIAFMLGVKVIDKIKIY